jgi:hypothetical protein
VTDLNSCNSITHLATLLKVNAYLCKKDKDLLSVYSIILCPKTKILNFWSAYTIARSSCSQVEYRCPAGVSTRDAVETILVSPSSLVCIETAAVAFPLASVCIIYVSGGCYARIFRVVSQKPTAFRGTISICSASVIIQGVAQHSSRS